MHTEGFKATEIGQDLLQYFSSFLKCKKIHLCVSVIGIPKADEVRNEGGFQANTNMSGGQLVVIS